MTQQLSTEVIGFVLKIKNGSEYKLSLDSGQKLEDLLVKGEPPKFVRVKCDGYISTISVSMIAELTRDINVTRYKADW